MGRWLVIFGLVLVALGLAWPLITKLGLGRLPGDLRIEREGFGFYFPITTSLIVSIVIYTWGSQSVIASVVGGAVTAGIAEFVHGMAQAAYDERHRRVD